MGFFKKKKPEEKSLYEDLKQTKLSLGGKIKKLFSRSNFDTEFYNELEEALVMADVSVETTMELIGLLKKQIEKQKGKITNKDSIQLLETIIESLLPENNFDVDEKKLNIIFVFGVNGVGKTTSIAKLANLLNEQGLSIIIAAADTYRAAAVEQLDIWSQRLGVHCIKHLGKSKPSAVIFDALDAALSRKSQVLIVDTAGRLHNKENLMDELKKLNKIIADKAPEANRYNLLVVDSNTGQNAVQQTKNFNESVGINGVFLSKMDSTAKGGIAVTLAHQMNIPVAFIGTGEKASDIRYFEKNIFVESIFE